MWKKIILVTALISVLVFKGYSQSRKINRILILGNSITHAGATPKIGWMNSWGMAALARDSDYVHRLMKSVHSVKPAVVFKVKYIGDFERNFTTYNTGVFDSLSLYKPDILIIKIAENVSDYSYNTKNFIKHYDDMINRIDPSGKCIKILVGGFWKNTYVTSGIKDYAKSKNCVFIPNDQLVDVKANSSFGIFENRAVASHPSNEGMKQISALIWDKVKVYLK